MKTNINKEAAVFHYRMFLDALGQGTDREGLKETPERVVRYYEEFLNPPEVKYTAFESEEYDQMIISKDIEFDSLCEHHNLPFSGTAAIAYIPGEEKQIVGISKLARTLEWFARDFQNQERITQQVGKKLEEVLRPSGVAVVLIASHSCMKCRGVKKSANMVTSYMSGAFKDELNTKNEFLRLIGL